MTLLQEIRNLTWFDLINKLKKILLKIVASSGGIPDAPIDGNQYARQDGAWSEVTGGGVSQDLQSVLDTGTEANTDGGYASILTGDPFEKSTNFEATSQNGNNRSSMSVETESIGLTNRDFSVDNEAFKSGDIYISNGRVNLSQTSSLGVSTLKFSSPPLNSTGAGAIFLIPPKITGDYVIATTEDVSLQTTLEGGRSWTDGVSSFSVGESSNSIYFQSEESILAVTPFSAVIQTGNSLKQTKLYIQPPTTDGLLVFSNPFDKPNGNYILATTDDIPKTVENTSTIALTQSDLNTAYPSANIGFRVIMPSLLTGTLIYEKISTGWISYEMLTVI